MKDKTEVKFKELTRPQGAELGQLTLEIVNGAVSIEVYLTITKEDGDRFMDAMRACIDTASHLKGDDLL